MIIYIIISILKNLLETKNSQYTTFVTPNRKQIFHILVFMLNHLWKLNAHAMPIVLASWNFFYLVKLSNFSDKKINEKVIFCILH